MLTTVNTYLPLFVEGGTMLMGGGIVDEHRFWKKEGEDTVVWSPSKSEVKYAKERERLLAEAMQEHDVAFARINK